MSFQDIRKSRKWLSREEITVILLLLIFLSAVLAVNIFLARILPGGELLYLRWSAARGFLSGQVEPYSATVAQRVQQVAYGHPAFSGEYPYVLNDPFYLVLLYTPLAFFSDFVLARGIWMLCSEAALVGIMLFSINLSEWEPPRWMFVCLMSFGLLGYFSLNSLVSASPTIFLTFLYLSILLALRSYSDELAGGLLVLTFYQWEVGALFFLFILIFVIANKRWGVLTGFAMSLFVLLVVSFLIYPGWSLPYARAVLSDWYRSANLTFGYILSFWFSALSFPIERIISIALLAILFFEWIGAVQSHFRRVVWAAALSLAVTPLIGFAIFPSNHVVLLLPLVVILTLVWERWTRSRVLASILVLALALFIPFGLYARSILFYNRLYSDLLSILPSVAAILGLYWMRWWVVHSPRTWLDQVGIRR